MIGHHIAKFICCERQSTLYFLKNVEEEIWELHEIMGHRNFIAMMLEEDEKRQIMKVHRYFGHRSGRRVWGSLRRLKSGEIGTAYKADWLLAVTSSINYNLLCSFI